MYDGQHSIIFGPIDGSAGVNTWTNWYLIPTSRPTMSMPGAQNRFTEIPGMSWSFDNSDYLTPDMMFADRSGSFEFLVDNDHANWVSIYDAVRDYLNGKRLRMTLTDDPAWYYEGRFTVDQFRSDPKNSRITIGYRVAPFKISIYADYTTDILWDPFNFERDIDWSMFYHISVNNQTVTRYIESYGIKTEVVAKLVSGGPVTASFGGSSKTLSSVGTDVSLGTTNRAGSKTLTLSGTGVVDVGWRKVSL